MDKSVTKPEDRMAQKRPHSSEKSEEISSTGAAASSGSEDVLRSDDKRDKLLRLMGGKKRKNETAASKWLERVRSREDELKVSSDLESQFNESLTKRITGASRRHLGIGFKDNNPTVTTQSEPTKSDSPITSSTTAQSTVVSSLSQRANVPSLSSRTPRQTAPCPQLGYNVMAHHQMYPESYAYDNKTNMSPQSYGYPPQMQNYGGYYYPSPNLPCNPPQPPPPPAPNSSGSNPPPPPDINPPRPKSKNAFYAQFKKAS